MRGLVRWAVAPGLAFFVLLVAALAYAFDVDGRSYAWHFRDTWDDMTGARS